MAPGRRLLVLKLPSACEARGDHGRSQAQGSPERLGRGRRAKLSLGFQGPRDIRFAGVAQAIGRFYRRSLPLRPFKGRSRS